MRAISLFVLGSVAGAAVLYAAMQVVGDDAPPPPATAMAAAPGHPVADVPPVPAESMQSVLDRLDRLSQQLAELRATVAARPAAGRVEVQPSSASEVGVEQLVAALEMVERRKIEAMDDGELMQLARQESRPEGDVGAAVGHYRELLRRDLDPKQRTEAMAGLAMQLRREGTPASLLASERTYRDMLREHGEASEVGRGVSYQLIWTVGAQGDKVRALALARDYTARLASDESSRRRGRWATAIMLEATGDKVGAKLAYEALLRELGNGPAAAGMVTDIERRLANL